MRVTTAGLCLEPGTWLYIYIDIYILGVVFFRPEDSLLALGWVGGGREGGEAKITCSPLLFGVGGWLGCSRGKGRLLKVYNLKTTNF